MKTVEMEVHMAMCYHPANTGLAALLGIVKLSSHCTRLAGQVTEKHTEKATIESKGKPITRKGEPENPAFKVERKGKNPVIKKVRTNTCLLCAGTPAVQIRRMLASAAGIAAPQHTQLAWCEHRRLDSTLQPSQSCALMQTMAFSFHMHP